MKPLLVWVLYTLFTGVTAATLLQPKTSLPKSRTIHLTSNPVHGFDKDAELFDNRPVTPPPQVSRELALLAPVPLSEEYLSSIASAEAETGSDLSELPTSSTETRDGEERKAVQQRLFSSIITYLRRAALEQGWTSTASREVWKHDAKDDKDDQSLRDFKERVEEARGCRVSLNETTHHELGRTEIFLLGMSLGFMGLVLSLEVLERWILPRFYNRRKNHNVRLGKGEIYLEDDERVALMLKTPTRHHCANTWHAEKQAVDEDDSTYDCDADLSV